MLAGYGRVCRSIASETQSERIPNDLHRSAVEAWHTRVAWIWAKLRAVSEMRVATLSVL